MQRLRRACPGDGQPGVPGLGPAHRHEDLPGALDVCDAPSRAPIRQDHRAESAVACRPLSALADQRTVPEYEAWMSPLSRK